MLSPASATTGPAVALIDDQDPIHAGSKQCCAQTDPPVRVMGNDSGGHFGLNTVPALGESTSYGIDVERTSRHP